MLGCSVVRLYHSSALSEHQTGRQSTRTVLEYIELGGGGDLSVFCVFEAQPWDFGLWNFGLLDFGILDFWNLGTLGLQRTGWETPEVEYRKVQALQECDGIPGTQDPEP